MLPRMRGYAAQIPRTLLGVFRNRELRRVELAFAAFNAAEWGVWIAMLVYAYGNGGATEAGVVALVQLVPSALFAGFTGLLADRHGPHAVLVGGYAVQAAAMAATAAVLLGHGPAVLAYACAAVAATAVTATRPAQAALVPALARTPDELTAANVTSGWIESLSMLAAPAAAGLLLAFGGAGSVFAVMAAAVAAGTVGVLPVRAPHTPPGDEEPVVGPLEALATVAREPGPRSLVWLLGVEQVVLGALDVLYVVLAVGLLREGGSTAGYLNAAFGAGGVLGIAVTATLVGRARLATPLFVALAAWAGALVLLGASPSLLVAFPLLALAGAGRSVVDVAGRTLLQRSTPTEALARVFAVLESVAAAGIAVGSIGASALVAVTGGRGAFIAMGVVLPLSLLVVVGSLRAADRSQLPVVAIARLRTLSLFALLPRPELELLARAAETVTVEAGTAVVRQGEPGDRFYVITSGEVEVTIDGRRVRVLGEGDFFGEIALLREVSRTATVAALSPCTLLSLAKEPFLAAVTGHRGIRASLDEVVVERLANAPA